MLSLIKLAKEGKLEKTGAKPKLPIKVDGVSSETLDVYKIPLDYLYYNDKNGRIATGISQYEGELHPANDQDNPNYNIFVEKLIEQDNTNALKRTTNSIKESGQQVYGYVLDDGRIVDGNRRFTALRDIHRTTGKTVYFEAVVLPFSYNNSTERVKIKQNFLESLDRSLKSQTPANYQVINKQPQTLNFIFGPVTFQRRYYQAGTKKREQKTRVRPSYQA